MLLGEPAKRTIVGVFLGSLSSVASGIALFASQPSFDFSALAWVGLAPLLLVFSGKRPGAAFLLFYLAGAIFFLGIFHWILRIPGYTLLHHALLALYMGAFFAVFGFLFAFLGRRLGFLAALFAAPFLWVSIEFARSNLSFLALPWGLLGHSQYKHPVIIQIASLAGAYGLSFLIVLMNSSLAAIVFPWQERSTAVGADHTRLTRRRKRVLVGGVTACLVVFALVYGYVVTSRPIAGERVQIAVVQGNIEQDKKWDPKYASMIMKTYTDLTYKAAEKKPTLILWPESATPRSISTDAKLQSQVRELARSTGAYLLLGSTQLQKFKVQTPQSAKYLNSAFLIPPGPGEIKNQRYDKIRLFPFGEYLPYKDTIPWRLINVPEFGNYLAGKEYTVFKTPFSRFGVTICWENIFPDLVREFVRHGAQFMVNVTNEAWFGPITAPYQFVAMSVFRAVENRVFVVRCTNTGISCFIDPYGRVINRVTGTDGGDIFVQGFMNGSIVPLDSRTIYTQYGDWFVWLCILVSMVFLVISTFRRRSSPGAGEDLRGV
jgi:apolipoprotein N-acyltransferase